MSNIFRTYILARWLTVTDADLPTRPQCNRGCRSVRGGLEMQVLEHLDPVTGASGYLVYDRADCRLAAGGCRMQAGLSLGTLTELAARMTLKQRVLGLNVDGAKCGIAYDPRSEGARDVLARFLAFLREELTRRFSMGCDMGTSFDQLEAIARGVGIDSIKGAGRTAQGLTPDEF